MTRLERWGWIAGAVLCTWTALAWSVQGQNAGLCILAAVCAALCWIAACSARP